MAKRAISLDYYRAKLARVLTGCSVSEFNAAVWGIEAVQREETQWLRKGFTYPKEMLGAQLGSKFYTPPWKLEDLYNFFAACDRESPDRRRLNPLPAESWLSTLTLFSKLQNSESGVVLEKYHVLDEIPKLGHKQFDWQSGYLSAPQFYRNLFVYGGPKSSKAFESNYGLSIQMFAKIGLATRAMFHTFENIVRNPDTSSVGISSDDFEKSIVMTSVSEANLQQEARKIHSGLKHTSYRPSVLRKFPLITVTLSDGREVIQCPVVDTLIIRITEGLFFDLIEVDDDKALRTEVGSRFQTYCSDLLRANFGNESIIDEFKYRVGANFVDSPDLMISAQDRLQVVCECKARKMPIGVRFGNDRDLLARNGLEEVSKGIAQIWQFVQHARSDEFLGPKLLADDPVGLVLTWESWFVMAPSSRSDYAFELAEKWLGKRNILIRPENKIPVAFAGIRDFEQVCRFVTSEQLKAVLVEASKGKFRGYHLDSIRADLFQSRAVSREYELRHKLKSILPWWETDIQKPARNQLEE